MKFKVEVEREEDGRWIAEVSELPGVLAYGYSMEQAQAKAHFGAAGARRSTRRDNRVDQPPRASAATATR